MIYEQPRLFGVIPVGKKRAIEIGESIPLKYKVADIEDMKDVVFIATSSLFVMDNLHIKYTTQIKGAPVTFENDTPEEINHMNIKSSGCFVRNVYRYSPDSN